MGFLLPRHTELGNAIGRRPILGQSAERLHGSDELVRYFVEYAEDRKLPIIEGVDVETVTPGQTTRFKVSSTSNGVFNADSVVIATGTHQSAKYPDIARPGMKRHAATDSMWRELHASEYKNANELAPGGVLVVGTGQSGCQIAEELNDAGRRVWLSTSHVGRLPRSYRGVDSIEWQRRMGFLDRPASALASPKLRFRADPHLSGKSGGHTINLRTLAKKRHHAARAPCRPERRRIRCRHGLKRKFAIRGRLRR